MRDHDNKKWVMHYAGGRYITEPAYCGKKNVWRVTVNIHDVTCKSCLKMLNFKSI